MEAKTAAPQREPNLLSISDYSVLMQIRSRALNDLQNRIPTDYYLSRAVTPKLVIYESENLARIRHLASVDFNLAKELAEESDRNPISTPREVSATEVLGLVGYYLMFFALDENDRTPHRLERMREAEAKLRETLTLYVMHLDEVEARPITSALAVSNAVPMPTIAQPTLDDTTLDLDDDLEPIDESCEDKTIDFDLLATRDQLLTAFKAWGLQSAWFGDLNSHSWLKAARRIKGQGQRGHIIEPLFCPLAVMNGLSTSIRGRDRLSQTKGWSILEHHFPQVSHANSIADPRDPSG